VTVDPEERRLTPQLLVDLVLDPRDPGYEAAARRRGPAHRARWSERPAVAAGFLVVGFLLAVAWVHTHRGAPAAANLHDRLVERAHLAQAEAARLATTEARLSVELNRVRAAALPGSPALVRELQRSQLLAGVIPAFGPGAEVRLSEPTVSVKPTGVAGRGGPAPPVEGHILLDRDVRSVVNQLWSDGAEAISVNAIRLTPASAVRFAGDAVLVDFQPIQSPYVIDAIGDPDTLVTRFAASDVASRYQTLAGAKGIGFSFDEKAHMSLPAGAAADLRFARVPTAPR
jgi:uncharacterized protein YlxW (UPF0749 family)